MLERTIGNPARLWEIIAPIRVKNLNVAKELISATMGVTENDLTRMEVRFLENVPEDIVESAFIAVSRICVDGRVPTQKRPVTVLPPIGTSEEKAA